MVKADKCYDSPQGWIAFQWLQANVQSLSYLWTESMGPEKKKRKTLSIADKDKIIDRINAGETMKTIIKKTGTDMLAAIENSAALKSKCK